MDTTQLNRLAGGCLSGGAFTLGPEQIDEPAVHALFRAFFPAGLRLGDAAREDAGAGGAVRVVGRTVDPILGLRDLSATLELGIEGGAAWLSLRLTALPHGWTPARSLAPLAGSLVESFAWEDAVLSFDSRRPDALPGTFEEEMGFPPASMALAAALGRGMTLEATLRPGAALQRMGWLIGTPRVRGGVEPLGNGSPRMWLRSAEIGAPLTLGTLAIPLAFELASVLVEPAGEVGAALPAVRARFVSELSFDAGGSTVTLPLEATFASPDPATVVLSARPAEASGVLLSALPALLGDIPLADLVPDDGPGFEALVLERVGFDVGTRTRSILSSSARVALAEPWAVGMGGLELTVRGLAATFAAETPADGPARFSATLSGTVELGGTDAALDARIGMPGLDFACGLAAGSSVDLTGLLGSIVPDLAGALPRLECAGLELRGNPRTGRYQLSARLAPNADPWVLNVGATRLTVSDAHLVVSRDPAPKPRVAGRVGGRVEVAGAEMMVDWELPGGVELSGELPDVSMRALARALCGGFAELPPGFPEITFEHSLVTISAGTGSYDFALSTDVAVGGMELGTVLFEVRRTPVATGFMAGFLVPARWTPAELWSELEEVFGWLTLRNPGLIVSSVDATLPTGNLQGMPAVPSRIVAGVTFFATLELEGVLGPVKTLLGATSGLNLAAVIANDVKQTRLIAATGAPAYAGSVAFDGFSLILAPGTASIELRSGTRITVGGDALDFDLAGILDPTGSITAALSLRAVTRPDAAPGAPEAGWSDPFGLRGLTIYGLGGTLSLEAAGWSVGLEGSFSVGSGGDDDRLAFGFAMQITNGALPTAAVASLRSAAPGGVTLTRMVRGFTAVDLGDYSVPVPSVPEGTPGAVAGMVPARVSPADVLDQLVFQALSGFLVMDPTGFRSPVDPAFVYRGVGFHADGSLFGVGIVADCDFQHTTGVYARGALRRPIDLFGVVKLSDAGGTGGARFVVDTRQIAMGGDLLTMSGALVVFGARAKLDARVRRDRLEFDLSVNGVPGIRACGLRCSLVVPTSFDMAGVAEVVLQGDVPLKSSGVDLGTLHLSGTAARVEIAAGADTRGARFSAKVRLRLAADLPEIGFSFKLGASFTELAGLMEAIVAELRKQGWKLLKPALGGAQAFCRLAAEGTVALASDAATFLRHGYGQTAEEAAATLRAAGRAAGHTAHELRNAYGAASDGVGRALKGAGYAVAEVDEALRTAFGLDAAKALAAMRSAGYAAEELARGHGWKEADAARMLRAAGYPADAATKALQSVYATPAGPAARLLKGAGYAANDTARALTSVYRTSAEDAGKLLKAAGYGSSEIAGVMKDVHGWSAKSTSKYMKDTLDYGKKTVEKAMKAAGYSGKQIDKALDDAWGSVKSGIGKMF